MEQITKKDLEWLSQSPDTFRTGFNPASGITVPASKGKSRSFSGNLTRLLFLFPLVLFLPFFILIKVATYVHGQYELNGWLSLGAGVVSCVLLLMIYVLFLTRKTRWRKQLFRYGSYLSLTVVLSFSVYGLFYLSGVHSKNEDVARVYRSLHPVLRVAVTTASLADQNLLITDIKRSPEDYLKWGLSPLQRSLHYPQEDGFVYAVDLRTIGHSELRNTVLEYGFRAIGLQTLRHTGTADHLHVSLKK